MNSNEIDVKLDNILFAANQIMTCKLALKFARNKSETAALNSRIAKHEEYIKSNTTSSIEYVIRYAEQINAKKTAIKIEKDANKKEFQKGELAVIENHMKLHIANAEKSKTQSDKASEFRKKQKETLSQVAEISKMCDEHQAELRKTELERKSRIQKIDTNQNDYNGADSGR